MDEPKSDRFTWAVRLGLALASLALLAGITAYAYAGTLSRLWADDFCYSSQIQSLGLFKGTLNWLQTGGNRYGALWGVAAVDFFGARAGQALPAVILALWLLACGWALWALDRRLGLRFRSLSAPLLACGLVLIAVFAAPDRLQTLYWRMGTLHYTLPLILFLIMAAMTLLAWPRSGKGLPAPEVAAVTALLAFAAAGASETYAAFQTGALLLAVLALIIFSRRRYTAAWPLLAAPLITSLAGMAVMATAPANAWRQALMPPPDNLGIFLTYTLRYTLDFCVQVLVSKPLPLAVWLALSAAAGLLVQSERSRRHFWLASAGMLLSGLGLAACAIAPSVYAGVQYPAGRALNVAWFALLIGWGGAVFCAAAALRPRFPLRLAQAAALGLALAGGIYGLRALPSISAEISAMTVKAERWDARDALIQTQRAAGELNVIVPEVDVVSTLEDINGDPDFWINACEAGYYHLDSIQALPEE
jgi:hypothetical protein